MTCKRGFENERKKKRNKIFESRDISEFLRNISRRVILKKFQKYFEDNLKMFKIVSRISRDDVQIYHDRFHKIKRSF